MHIAIVVDHPLRDLPGLILVADRLARGGNQVSLVPFVAARSELLALCPDFVLLNYFRNNYRSLYGQLKHIGISYGILETEGGLYGDLDAYGRTVVDDPELLEGVTVYCSWGNKIADYLRRSRHLSSDQIELTGLPRFDFYHPSLRRILHLQPVDLADDRRPFLLNTKVAVANPKYVTVQQEFDIYVKQLGISYEETMRHLTLGRQTIDGFADLMIQLGGDFPGRPIVLRPHPHERVESYRERLPAGHEDLIVTNSGTVDRWISRADVIVHRQCTTAVEAMIAGVPAIAPVYIPTSANAPACEDVSFRCSSYDEVRDLLRAISAGERPTTDAIQLALQQVIDDWFCTVDGAAHHRVGDAVMNRAGRRGRPDRDKALRLLRRLDNPMFSKRGAAARVLARLGSVLPTARRYGWLYPGLARLEAARLFDVAQVQALLDLYADVAGQRAAVQAAVEQGYLDGYPGASVRVSA